VESDENEPDQVWRFYREVRRSTVLQFFFPHAGLPSVAETFCVVRLNSAAHLGGLLIICLAQFRPIPDTEINIERFRAPLRLAKPYRLERVFADNGMVRMKQRKPFQPSFHMSGEQRMLTAYPTPFTSTTISVGALR